MHNRILSLKNHFFSQIVNLRRDFHRYPELSFNEYRTTEKIKEFLSKLKIEYLDIGLKTGVIALLKGASSGPTIALRADIDALPIEELTNTKYCSTEKGRMHACGHDLHTAGLLGTAMILSELKKEIRGNILFIFQPAEEINQGAKHIVSLGLFEKIPVDLIVGAHNQPLLPWGKIAVKEGALMASVDTLRFTIHGTGGHGGLPQTTNDPIVAAAAMILNLQTIVSRNISPFEPSVISLGSINAGNANNVIPAEVNISGTVRSFDEETRHQLRQRIFEVLQNTAQAYQVTVDIQHSQDLSAVINSKELYDWAHHVIAEIGGNECIVSPTPSTGGEDFSVYTEKVPGFFYWFGVGNEEKRMNHPWHSPYFDGDERGMALSSAVMACMALKGPDFVHHKNQGEMK